MSANGIADLVFVNGDVYTVDAARSRGPDAVAVRDGRDRRGRHRRRDPRPVGPRHRGRRPRRADAAARVPGRARASGRRRARPAAVRPARRRTPRGATCERRGLCARASRRAVDPRRRLVAWTSFPRGMPDQGGARRGRVRPAGVPAEPRRPQRVGELGGARDRRDHRATPPIPPTAGSSANADGDAAGHPARGRDAPRRSDIAPDRRRPS